MLYYVARWYDPVLGRFAQADSIVPGAGKPLAFDRYAYALNSPVRYSDPSGHLACNSANVADDDCTDLSTQEILETYYGITLDGEWTQENISAVYKAALAVGRAFAQVIKGTVAGAFKAVYNHITIGFGNCAECNGAGGYTYGAHSIKFASLSEISEQRRINNIIHEMGHAFDWVMAEVLGETNMPRSELANYWNANPFPSRATAYTKADGRYYGLAGPRNQRVWHQNPTGTANEEFGDTFLAWVTNSWEANADGVLTIDAQHRIDFINPRMTGWLENFN